MPLKRVNKQAVIFLKIKTYFCQKGHVPGRATLSFKAASSWRLDSCCKTIISDKKIVTAVVHCGETLSAGPRTLLWLCHMADYVACSAKVQRAVHLQAACEILIDIMISWVSSNKLSYVIDNERRIRLDLRQRWLHAVAAKAAWI
jgi:hypothetical protein